MKIDQKSFTFMMSNKTWISTHLVKSKSKSFTCQNWKRTIFFHIHGKEKKNHKFHHVNLEKEVVSQLFIEIKLKIMNFIISKFQKNWFCTYTVKVDQKLITFMISNKTCLLSLWIKNQNQNFEVSKLKKNHFLTYLWKGNKKSQILSCQIGKRSSFSVIYWY